MTKNCHEIPSKPPCIVRGVEVGDRWLVERLAAGDDDALRELVDRYGGLVLGIARRVSGSTVLAEDVVQEVFTALWRAPERFDPSRGSLRAYLGILAQRRAADARRSEGRRQAREERSAGLDRPLSGEPGSDGMRAVDEEAVAEAVRHAIERLPEEQRAVVELAFWQGRTCREVAALLGIPEGTAKSRMRLAQQKLTHWLAPVTAGTT